MNTLSLNPQPDPGNGPWLRWQHCLISLAGVRALRFTEIAWASTQGDGGERFYVSAEYDSWYSHKEIINLGTDRAEAEEKWEQIANLLAIKPKEAAE